MASVLNSNLEIIKKFHQKLPKFEDGRINYRGSKESAVINVFIIYEGQLLLLKRSNDVGNYKGRWNVVAGYYDEPKPVQEKALLEVGEETGIGRDQIANIKIFENFKLEDKEINKIFYVFPVSILLKSKPEIILDWEHTEYRWTEPENLKNFDIVYGLDIILKKILA